jgi:type IV pilus assembly protein PilM
MSSATSPRIGIDIGSASVKVVELAPAGKDRWKLLTAASMPSVEGGIVPGNNNLPAFSGAIKKLLAEAGIKSKQVVAALPEEQISTHIVDMPLMSDPEIEQALQWQVEQYIPIPADRAVWSHEVISRNTSSGGVEVLLVAAAKSLVDAYSQVLEQAGLEVVALESELMAVARAELDANSGLALVVDIGAKSTDVGIVRAGQLLFARTIATAGDAFTRAIETTLGLDRMVAEQYKNVYGFSASHLEGKLQEAMKPVLAIIAAEIRKTIDFYVSKHVGESVRLVTLSGGVAALPDVVSVLSGLLGIEVAVGNPFAKVILDPAQKKALTGNEPFYAVSIGLGMREEA